MLREWSYMISDPTWAGVMFMMEKGADSTISEIVQAGYEKARDRREQGHALPALVQISLLERPCFLAP